jgi:flavin reductase (DIM6/NTAB) family NADH-FMN oxidoreductase RutF
MTGVALGPSFFPIPSALVTFCSPDGGSHMRMASWVGIIGSQPASLSVTLKRQPDGAPSPWWGGDFAVNLPGEDLLCSPAFLDIAAREDMDLLTGAGYSLVDERRGGPPLFAQCPVRIECRCGVLRPGHGQDILSGEIALIHAGDQCHGRHTPPDLFRIRPFSLLKKGMPAGISTSA